MEHYRQRLIALIPYFHGVYARTKNPMALEIAQYLGIGAAKWKENPLDNITSV